MSKRALTIIGLVVLMVTLSAPAQAREVEDYSKTINEFKQIAVVAPFFGGYAVDGAAIRTAYFSRKGHGGAPGPVRAGIHIKIV